MNRIRRATVFGTLAMVALYAPAAELSAGQLVEKNIAARGGLAAWRAIQALTLSGEMDAGGKQPTRLPYVMDLKRPHKSRLEITFAGVTAVQTFDGQEGWKVRPYLNRKDVQALTRDELRAELATDELDGPLIDHERKGVRVELAGSETLDGRPAYKLKLTGADGHARNLWLDAETFLETRIDGQPRRVDGRMRKVTVYFRDFKKEGPVTLPHELETKVEGQKQGHRIFVKKVDLNPALDDAMFSKPKPAATAVKIG